MRQLKTWTAALSLPLFLSGCTLFGAMKLTCGYRPHNGQRTENRRYRGGALFRRGASGPPT